jgi:hypothetical protein
MALYLVTNTETRTTEETRYIRYHLTKPLPAEWDEWPIDDKGIWLNENAEFLDDEFEPESNEADVEEKTIAIEILD